MESADAIFAFGRCEVRLATREVLVDGEIQAAGPKVFELLTYLLTCRHRAVSKKELTREIWRTEQLSESVLARTVMLARRVIGDSAVDPLWIQNVFGFGYRFVGQVVEQQSSTGIPKAKPASGPVRRVGLLSLQNQTQNTDLAWTQFGLMALVGQALERDHRISVVNIGQNCFSQLPTDSTFEAIAMEACDLFGLNHAVAAVLRSHGSHLWLDFQLYGPKLEVLMGSLRGSDPLALGERLARAIADVLLRGEHSAVALPSTDAFVNQIYARGMECMFTHEWNTASALMGAAAALQPDNLPIELKLVECQLSLKVPDARLRAEKLLQRLKVAQNPQLISNCHNLIALAIHFSDDTGSEEVAECHRREAVDQTEQAGLSAWTIKTRLDIGNQYIELGQLKPARELLERALADSQLTKSLFHEALCQQNLSIADRNEGNLTQAKQRLEMALHLWRRMQRQPLMGHGQMHLAQVNLHLGLFEDAQQLCDEALACFERDQVIAYDATIAGLGLVYLELGQAKGVVQVAQLLRTVANGRSPLTVPQLVAFGCEAVIKGDTDHARQCLMEAIARNVKYPGLSYRLRCMHAWLRLELAYGGAQQLELCSRNFAELAQASGWPEREAALHYCAAGQHHLAGDRDQALAAVLRAATELPLGRSSQMARLDAAWLLLEQGDLDMAQTLMSGAPTWRDSHPAGMALKARLLAAQGAYRAAYLLQLQALASRRATAPALQMALADRYELAAQQAHLAAPLPSLPRLLCACWMGAQKAGHHPLPV